MATNQTCKTCGADIEITPNNNTCIYCIDLGAIMHNLRCAAYQAHEALDVIEVVYADGALDSDALTESEYEDTLEQINKAIAHLQVAKNELTQSHLNAPKTVEELAAEGAFNNPG